MTLKPSRLVHALAICALLTACGGGGDSDTALPQTTQAEGLELAPFEGAWQVRPAFSTCEASFDYNPGYYYRFIRLDVTSVDGILNLSVKTDVFEDASCMTKMGRLDERFTMSVQAAASPGRTEVIKGQVQYTGMSVGADGGLGLSLTAIPDGSLHLLHGAKLLVDRDLDRLYVTSSSDDTTLDSEGYPVAIQDDLYLIPVAP